jgi:hypothetical protein
VRVGPAMALWNGAAVVDAERHHRGARRPFHPGLDARAALGEPLRLGLLLGSIHYNDLRKKIAYRFDSSEVWKTLSLREAAARYASHEEREILSDS